MGSRGKGHRTVHADGFEILVGKGARDNDVLTTRLAEPRDFWLHAAGYAGSHVVVRNPDDVAELPPDVLRQAAELAVWHSKARGAGGKVEVHLCRAGDVKKPRGYPAGKVVLKRWEAVKIYPRDLGATDDDDSDDD